MQERNVTAEKTLAARSQTQNLTQAHAQRGSASEAWRGLPFSLRLFLSDIRYFAEIVRAEVRSCYGRICVLRANRIRWGRFAFRGLPLGPLSEYGTDGRFQLCKETLARNLCIEDITAKYPWLSEGDDLLILEGWERAKHFYTGRLDMSRKDMALPCGE
jgi:hypothetical protein